MGEAMNHLIAQVSSIDFSSPLFREGTLGVMLAWFMFRFEKWSDRTVKELRTLSHRQDGLTKALLITELSRDTIGEHGKKAAQEMIAKIEARESD